MEATAIENDVENQVSQSNDVDTSDKVGESVFQKGEAVRSNAMLDQLWMENGDIESQASSEIDECETTEFSLLSSMEYERGCALDMHKSYRDANNNFAKGGFAAFDKSARGLGSQPGRRRQSIIKSVQARGKKEKKLISWKLHVSQQWDYFKHVMKNGMIRMIVTMFISCFLTTVVLYTFPDPWQKALSSSLSAVAVLGGLVSFALVFRVQTCYSRWWEARCLWGKLIYAAVHAAQQGSSWIQNSNLRDGFVKYLIVFPYASKAMLRGKSLKDEMEEGPTMVSSGLLSQEELNEIAATNWEPHFCIDMLRAIMNEELSESHGQVGTKKGIHDTALYPLEDSLRDLAVSIGGMIRLNGTGLPLTYDVFMQHAVFLFICCASVAWAPNLQWYTPVITSALLFLMTTVIVIGDRMLKCFQPQLVGLPLQKFCVATEDEVTNVFHRCHNLGEKVKERYRE